MQKIILFVLIPFFLTGCKLSDLRTPEMQTAMNGENAEQKGKQLLEEAYQTHGGPAWDALSTYRAVFKEEFYKLKMVSAFPKGKATVYLDYKASNYDGRLTFADTKKKGEEWGLADWESWSRKPEQGVKWKHSKKIKFWLPTYQYFIQFPMKIREATFIRYAGESNIQGKKYLTVFASWNSDEPQKDMDQYLIHLDPTTKRVEIIEYTIRGAGGWLRGACIYDTYLEVGNIIVPGVMKVLGLKADLEKPKEFHQMEVAEFLPNYVHEKQLSHPFDE